MWCSKQKRRAIIPLLLNTVRFALHFRLTDSFLTELELHEICCSPNKRIIPPLMKFVRAIIYYVWSILISYNTLHCLETTSDNRTIIYNCISHQGEVDSAFRSCFVNQWLKFFFQFFFSCGLRPDHIAKTLVKGVCRAHTKSEGGKSFASDCRTYAKE